MAIRNVVHSIHAGEISLGVAVGVESMSLKSVSLSSNFATRLVVLVFVFRLSSVGSYKFPFVCTVPALPPQ